MGTGILDIVVNLTPYLEKALEEFKRLVDELKTRVPEPTQAQIDSLFAQAMAAYPGSARAAVEDVKTRVTELLLTGKSKVKPGKSALA